MDEAEPTVRLFRQTLPELYAFVARRCGGDRALAEDVTQEAWLRALATWPRDGAPREPLAWLKTTAANLIHNHRRSTARREPAAAVDLDSLEQPAAAEQRAAQHSADELSAGLARLAEDDARLIERFHLGGASTRELAREQGASERAIEGRLHRARRKLREYLERKLR